MKHVFVDTNIFIYASGDSHPHKEPSHRLLEKVAVNQIEAVSNTEVLQEILYRYWAIKEKERGSYILERIVRIVPLILPVNKKDVIRAKGLLEKYPQIEPRDAIHAATMLERDIKSICSYDRHFDQIREIKRIEP